MSQTQPPEVSPLENALIKARVTIGPISLDVEDVADKLTLLVTKIVESFIYRNIIPASAIGDIKTESSPREISRFPPEPVKA